ncbi:MAG: nuclear transport factor 2 family protein [Steroidobacteraceae bacterium]
MSRLVLILSLLWASCAALGAGTPTCRNNVAKLDTEFQAAVKRNDFATVARLLPNDYILISSTGAVATKGDLVNEARQNKYVYSHQEDSHQVVRIWENTAVLTALLWAEGTTGGRHFNLKIWFSDTYACTPQGWRYVFGQVGSHIPVK